MISSELSMTASPITARSITTHRTWTVDQKIHPIPFKPSACSPSCAPMNTDPLARVFFHFDFGGSGLAADHALIALCATEPSLPCHGSRPFGDDRCRTASTLLCPSPGALDPASRQVAALC